MKKDKLMNNFLLLTVTNIISKILSLVYIPILIYIIGDEGYGIYYASYNIYMFFYIVTISGVSIAIPRMISQCIAQNRENEIGDIFDASKFTITLFALISFILMLIMAYPLSALIHFKKALIAIILLSPSLLFISSESAYRGYFQGIKNMKPIAVSQIIEQAVNVVLSLAAAFILSRKGLAYACAGGTLGTTVGAVISNMYLRRIYRCKRQKNSDEKILSPHTVFKRILKFSLPIMVCSAITYAGNNIVDVANIKIGLIKAGFTEANASVLYSYLGKYIQLLNVPFTIVSALAIAILPEITISSIEDDSRVLREKINRVMKLCLIIAIPSAFGMSVLSKSIYSAIFISHSGGYNLMKYGSVVIILMSVSQIQTTILQSLGKIFESTSTLVLGIIAKIILNFFIVRMPFINIYGIVIGYSISYIIPIVMNSITLKNLLGVKYNTKDNIIKPVVSSAVMSLLVVGMNTGFHYLNILWKVSNDVILIVEILYTIFMGALCYYKMMIKMKRIDKKDFNDCSVKIKQVLGRN